jgi:hypothetical protein
MVDQVITDVSNGKSPTQRSSIFQTLLDPPTTDEYKKPKDYEKPTARQLTDDGVSFLVAAAVTTGNSMMVSSYHILKNKEIYSRLRKEILTHFPLGTSPRELDYAKLERLPYLVSFTSKYGKLLCWSLIRENRRDVSKKVSASHTERLVVFLAPFLQAVLCFKDTTYPPVTMLACQLGSCIVTQIFGRSQTDLILSGGSISTSLRD